MDFKIKFMLNGMISVIIFVIACQKKTDFDTIAVIDRKHKITTKEFITNYRGQLSKGMLRAVNSESANKSLNQLINNKLFLIDAYDEKLDEDSETWEKIQSEYNTILFNLFEEKECVNNLISEQDIQNAYAESDYKDQSYNEVRNRIKTQLRLGHQEEINARIDSIMKPFLDTNSIKYNDKNVHALEPLVLDADFELELFIKLLKTCIEENGDKVLYTHSKGEYTYKTFLEKIDRWPFQALTHRETIDGFKPYWEGSYGYEYIIKLAEEKKMNQQPEFKNRIKKYLEEAMVKRYKEIHIENYIYEDNEDTLKQYYKLNKEDWCFQLGEAHIYSIENKNKKEIKKLMAKNQNGVRFKKLTGKVQFKIFKLNQDGTWVPNNSDIDQQLGEVVFDLKKNEVFGPIEYKDQNADMRYAMVQAIKIIPDKILAFDEAKNIVQYRYSKKRRLQLTNIVIDELREKYPIDINAHQLNRAVAGIKVLK